MHWNELISNATVSKMCTVRLLDVEPAGCRAAEEQASDCEAHVKKVKPISQCKCTLKNFKMLFQLQCVPILPLSLCLHVSRGQGQRHYSCVGLSIWPNPSELTCLLMKLFIWSNLGCECLRNASKEFPKVPLVPNKIKDFCGHRSKFKDTVNSYILLSFSISWKEFNYIWIWVWTDAWLAEAYHHNVLILVNT